MSGYIAPGSWARVSVVALADPELPNGAKVVLCALGRFADASGQCYPSEETTAAACAMSPRMVRYHLRRLEQRGYVSTYPAKRIKGGGWAPNRYVLHFPPPPQGADARNGGEGSDPTGEEPTLTSGAPGAIERDRQSIAGRDRQPIAGCSANLGKTPADEAPATGNIVSGDRQPIAATTGNPLPPNYPIRTTQIESAQSRAHARARRAAVDCGEEQQWRLDDPDLDREWKGQASEPDPDDPDSWFPNGWGKRVPEPDATEPAETPQVARQGKGDDAGAETPSAPPVDPHGGLTGMARRFSERFLAAQGDIEAGKRVMAEYCAWMDAGEPEDWQEWSANGPAPTDRPPEPERRPGTVVPLRPAPRRTPKREFATELREARERSGVTAFVLGQLTGLGEQGITNIEQGRATVTKMMRERIVAALIEAREGAMNGRMAP